MNKDVRISRKEQRRARTINEQQTYQEHKRKSRGRSATIRDFGDIFAQYGVPDPADLRSTIDELIVEFRDGGIPRSDYAYKIFDPSLVSLTTLPIGLLDHKEERLPPSLLPQTKEELQAHCERMIIRNRDEQLVDTVAEGWPGPGSGRTKLHKHVTDLWLLHRVGPDLYRYLLCGQHGEVLYRLQQHGIPREFTYKGFIEVMVCQGLLWCTNDIQLILARNSLGERNPFGLMVSSDYRKLEPTRIANDLRGHLDLLRVLLAFYATTIEQELGKGLAELPDDPIATVLKNRIENHSDNVGTNLLTLRSKLDEIIPVLRRLLKKGGKRLRQELEKPIGTNELEKNFHGIWFSGLSNVQAAAVPILRYLQAEAALEGMIRDLAPVRGVKVETRKGTALPAFSQSRLRKGWPERAKDLLYLYRRELLDDADMSSDPEKRAARSKNAGWEAIEKALEFLQNGGERLMLDDHGDENSRRRTYYLLDVLPEARLCLQSEMVKGNQVVAKIPTASGFTLR